MQNLNVTLVQANQIWENPEKNISNYEHLLEGITTDLILLPEMFQTCFSMNTALAEQWKDSSSILWLKELAKTKHAAVYTSLMIREGDHNYNRGVFVFPDGRVDYYDKRKVFGLAGEDQHFEPGKNRQIVEYNGWKIQLQICYDLRFPEIVRNSYTNESPEYDVILYVANWPAKRSEHWKSLLKARAIENQSYVVGVNRVGEDANGFYYSGDSALIDALGNTNELPAGEECLQTFVMNKSDLNKIRELLPFLKDA